MGGTNCVNIKNKLNYHNKHKNVLVIVMRCCIVIFVFLLACILCYLTIIVPDPPDAQCNRKCNNVEWPMICRYKLIIESQTVHDKIRFTINKTSPGPPIIVCHNDIIVIEVINQIPELSITFHWHGQHQNETPFMDGVPMITQCPISSFTTFQYKFRATQVGTHFYYAYSGNLRNQGAVGKFIVHAPNESLTKLYDVDSPAHIVLVSEFDSRVWVDVVKYVVMPWVRYRFRMIYGSGEYGYPIKLEIQNHTLQVIAVDGHAIKPILMEEINLNLGDRIDFVLYADQIQHNEYFIDISSEKLRRPWRGLLSYEKRKNVTTEAGVAYEYTVAPNESNFDKRLRRVNRTVYLPIIRHNKCPTDNKFIACSATDGILGIGNITFTFPSKPYYLLTNVNNNVLRQQWPNECVINVGRNILDERCENIGFGNLCECVHVQRVDVGEFVEIIFMNFDERASHTYHLHGYSFYIVGVAKISTNSATLEQIKDKNINNDLLERNFDNPPHKDTVTIEHSTIVAIRFVADNPGYWMLRDFKSNSWTRGIDVLLQVLHSMSYWAHGANRGYHHNTLGNSGKLHKLKSGQRKLLDNRLIIQGAKLVCHYNEYMVNLGNSLMTNISMMNKLKIPPQIKILV